MEAVEFGGVVFCKERIHDIGNSGRPATIVRKTVPHLEERVSFSSSRFDPDDLSCDS